MIISEDSKSNKEKNLVPDMKRKGFQTAGTVHERLHQHQNLQNPIHQKSNNYPCLNFIYNLFFSELT